MAYASRVRGRVRGRVRVKVRDRVSVRSQERCVLFVCDRVRGSVRDGRVRVHGLDPGPLFPGFLGTWNRPNIILVVFQWNWPQCGNQELTKGLVW